MTTRVLVVEDEPDIRELIDFNLQREGFEVVAVANGEDALRLLNEKPFQLVVLDWMLPGVSGLEIARSIRRQMSSQVLPILMVTARAQAADVVSGLEAGADDYVTKPFDSGVLMARVRALLRRGERAPTPEGVMKIGALFVDPERFEVRCGSEKIALTASEFKLLLALVRHRGRVLTRENLISLVQGEGVSVVGRAVDTHVFGLRKKLGNCADFVETIRGIGYRIKPEE